MADEMRLFDILGPVMIGPSSSHTAGAARIGRTALKLLGEDVAEADIGFAGSFASTYRGHGKDVKKSRREEAAKGGISYGKRT